jgi:guanylate kinase
MDLQFKRRGILVILSAPSGAGKSTVLKALLERMHNIRYSISSTSRSPRGDEVNGTDYFFLSKEEFERHIGLGKFLEYAEVHGNYYGTPKDWIEKQLGMGTDVALDIDVQGAGQVRKIMPDDTLEIFLMPPSMKVLEERLRGRGTDSEEQIQLRLNNAEQELAQWKDYDYTVVNENLDAAVRAVENIICSERQRASRQTLEEN